MLENFFGRSAFVLPARQVPLGKLPLQLGWMKAIVWGGPYVDCPQSYCGVKMAEEIRRECAVTIPTKDFSVPNMQIFRFGLFQGVKFLLEGESLYVGCAGGIGRTGLYMGGLVKVMSEYRHRLHRPRVDPFLYVRHHYHPHAIETPQQQAFLSDLVVDDLVEWVFTYLRLFPPNGGTV